MRKPGSRFKPALSFACLCVWQIRCLGAAVMDLWPACLILLVVNPGTGYLVGGIPVVWFLLQGLLLLSAGVSMSLACITLQSLLVLSVFLVLERAYSEHGKRLRCRRSKQLTWWGCLCCCLGGDDGVVAKQAALSGTLSGRVFRPGSRSPGRSTVATMRRLWRKGRMLGHRVWYVRDGLLEYVRVPREVQLPYLQRPKRKLVRAYLVSLFQKVSAIGAMSLDGCKYSAASGTLRSEVTGVEAFSVPASVSGGVGSGTQPWQLLRLVRRCEPLEVSLRPACVAAIGCLVSSLQSRCPSLGCGAARWLPVSRCLACRLGFI